MTITIISWVMSWPRFGSTFSFPVAYSQLRMVPRAPTLQSGASFSCSLTDLGNRDKTHQFGRSYRRESSCLNFVRESPCSLGARRLLSPPTPRLGQQPAAALSKYPVTSPHKTRTGVSKEKVQHRLQAPPSVQKLGSGLADFKHRKVLAGF